RARTVIAPIGGLTSRGNPGLALTPPGHSACHGAGIHLGLPDDRLHGQGWRRRRSRQPKNTFGKTMPSAGLLAPIHPVTAMPDDKSGESQGRAPTVSFVSLGCPKALVDSERIVTHLRAEGYELVREHAGADVVIVNTCGFLASAQSESLAATGAAMASNGRVVVTGCMGAE